MDNPPPLNPPQKSSSASCFLTGCVVTLLVGILCVAGGYFFLKQSGGWEKITSALGSGMEMAQVMQKLMKCPEIEEAVGSPLNVKNDGSQNTRSNSTLAGMETEMDQILSGPKGEVTLRIGMLLSSAGMKVTRAKLIKSDGTEVDLGHHLQGTEAAPAPASNP